MNNELGVGWQAKFDSFDKLPFAAASLGQVHKANFDGKNVVCKLQYPDMLSIVEADINQLKLTQFVIQDLHSRSTYCAWSLLEACRKWLKSD